ncbi:hepatic and glial cell adhesion molecule-like isoform X1 [Oncorhynchus masou masou]|uniref:hepatic and glial cell adhesion molecule-like isoform X1 n=1 Tax=Oncorhynchus masou masou TaxID=90313 RepID=UPI003182BE7E
METVFGLLVILAGVSHGMESPCDAREDGAQCYGALGGTVYLQLITNASGHQVKFWKDPTGAKTEILTMRKNISITKGPINGRSEFIINNGIFRIDNTVRNDSDKYCAETFNANGILLDSRRLQLFIEAPVTQAKLSSKCLSHGEMRVHCSSEGDSPQYSWTLDGHPLNNNDYSFSEKTNSITLQKGLSGDLNCTIRNNISSVTVSRVILPCPEIIGTVAGSLAAVVLVLVVVLVVYCVQKKKKPPKTSAKDDSPDVEYADVRIQKKQMRQKEREALVELKDRQVNVAGGPQQTMEVEYGQIKTLQGPRQKVDTPEEEDCVYARVQRGQ